MLKKKIAFIIYQIFAKHLPISYSFLGGGGNILQKEMCYGDAFSVW